MIEGRVRRSCGSLEWQTAHSHPSVGTPIEVPLPSTVKVAFIFSLSLAGSYRFAFIVPLVPVGPGCGGRAIALVTST
jgi:hypothetical protein